MKKNKLIGIIALACVIVLCATLFAGCKGKLKTPEDIKYENGKFLWNSVVGADGYMVSVNDSENEVYVDTASVSAFDARFKNDLIDKDVNTLNVRAVTLDKDGKVKKSSKTAKYEFDYATPVETAWTVSFDLNYVNAPQAQTITVKSGETFDKPANPIRLGWTFAGWYRDSQCLIAASFTPSGKNIFNVTANMTLYAKWTASDPVPTTSIYFYSETWTQVSVKPYQDETELFTGNGIAMASVAGKANWYKADIVDTATSVIFTYGENATESATFDKTKPYCKDGVWTATMPVDIPDEPEHGVYIKVGNSSPQQLTENPAVAGEYMIDVTLEAGDKVVITMDGATVSNYDADCKFTGTATIQGKHSFYVTVERIWVELPEVPSVAFVIVNGDTENANGMKEHPSDDATVEIQYSVTVTLKKGDTVKVVIGAGECKNYESACGFNGTANLDGEYTFYVKKYSDSRDDSIWVTVPLDVPTTKTMVYFHITTETWSKVYLYCWHNKTEAKPAVWPGTEMTAMGGGWYSLEIQPGYNMVIFDNGNGGGTNQTGNLVLEVVDGCAYYDHNGVTTDRPAE